MTDAMKATLIAAVMGTVVWVVIGYLVAGSPGRFESWLENHPISLGGGWTTGWFFWAAVGVAMGLLYDYHRKLSSGGDN